MVTSPGFKLEFNPDRLPRSMTKKQWREIHRWRRVAENRIREELNKALAENGYRFRA